MKILERKWNGILYEGGFDNFTVDGSFHMEEEVLYKNNPRIESQKRLDMAYLLLTNPQMIETIKKTNAYFFHGTNANALPHILKYGLNSVDTSTQNNIPVTTGEEWSRVNGKRKFISLTDSLSLAMRYSNKKPTNNSMNTLLNFSVIIGTSLEDMSNILVCSIDSDMSEVGVIDNLPLSYIKFLAVPDDKVDFVKKMVGNKNIEIISINTKDFFYIGHFIDKLYMLEHTGPNIKSSKPLKPTYSKSDIAPVVATRKTSKIQEIFEVLKAKIYNRTSQTNEKNNSERS